MSLSAVSIADGQPFTVSGPSSSFGTKPNGALIARMARYQDGFTGLTDPLSRTTWSDSGFPYTGQTGPVGGLPGLQSVTAPPGKTQSLQVNYPGAAVITGTLTNGSNQVTSVTDSGVSGATPFASIDYAFGGIIIGDLTTGFQAGTNSSQPSLGSGIIVMSTTYSGTTGTFPLQIAYGPDQYGSPRINGTSAAQDQLFWVRGMNTFPFVTGNFSFQNNKFLRLFSTGLNMDMALNTDGSAASLVQWYNEGTTRSGALEDIALSSHYSWTANQWYTQIVQYHGNSTASSTDGGIIHLADASALVGTVGTQPTGHNFWGNNGATGTNPTMFGVNDMACRPWMPQGGNQTYTAIYAADDSCAHLCITGTVSGTPVYEIQYPTTASGWSDTLVSGQFNLAYLNSLGPLTGLQLWVQQANYSRTLVGTFT